MRSVVRRVSPPPCARSSAGAGTTGAGASRSSSAGAAQTGGTHLAGTQLRFYAAFAMVSELISAGASAFNNGSRQISDKPP